MGKEMSEIEKRDLLVKLRNKMEKESVGIPPEIAKVINERLWEIM